jgi:hypothetical protein
LKTSSAKAKGRRAAQAVKDLLIQHSKYSNRLDQPLDEADIVVTSSGDTGEDLKLSPLARTVYPVQWEVKNQEKLNIWASMKQAETHGKYIPVLAFTRNRSEIYAALKLEDLIQLLVNQK